MEGNTKEYGAYHVHSNQWHFRFYWFCVTLWCHWTEEPEVRFERPNLCLYLRTMLIYFPIVACVVGTIYLSPIWICILVAKSYGFIALILALANIGIILLALVAVVVVFVGAILVCEWISNKYDVLQRRRWHRATQSRETLSQHPDVTPPQAFTFFQLFMRWWKERHDMVCRPIVVIDELKEGEV